ncbi:hypothetical protein Poli38472_013940 [Pythium oligandrum]|uniref:Uncharacterized protein n=1 Tax=Pythium oligandrum TaxID=41045 RepID=A0A8K1C2I0_PYTOL|nr:hypothetical protein Poli38472_013940 [Pythium oligandrum]|eukprot:TMW55178.1 hypothetical protein Poli38472_013940 [Pythium oligandrum]
MMEPQASECDGALSPTRALPADATSTTATEQRDMFFFRRPDLSGRHLFFQGNGRSPRAETQAEPQIAPVQLVTMDGQSHLGVPLVHPSGLRSRHSETVHSNTRRDGARPQSERLSRLLVTSEPVSDLDGKLRLRRNTIAFTAAICIKIIFTILMLFPDSRDAWFHTDVAGSVLGRESMNRVSFVRTPLLVLGGVESLLGIVSVVFQRENLIAVYVLGLIASDMYTVVLLLPHVFFLLRILFDGVLLLLAWDTRSHLTQQWFVTNFHRLRY